MLAATHRKIDSERIKAGSILPMDEGRERDNTSRVGDPLTLPSLYLSTFQPSQRGFFWVHMFVEREREPSARIFKLLRHQFHGIVRLVSETLYLLYTLPLCLQNCSLSKKQGSPKWSFLCFFKVWKFGLWRTTSTRCVCYITLSLTPSGLNLCQIVNTVHIT